jgi:hypothetical protein
MIFVEFGEFLFERFREQCHEAADFPGGTVPVFGREGIEGEVFESDRSCVAYDLPYCPDSGAMSFDPGKIPLFRPPAVPVHDDGCMHGKPAAFERRLAGIR